MGRNECHCKMLLVVHRGRWISGNCNSDDNSDFCPLLMPAWHMSALHFFSLTTESFVRYISYVHDDNIKVSIQQIYEKNNQTNSQKFSFWPNISIWKVWCPQVEILGQNQGVWLQLSPRVTQLDMIKMSNWTCVCLLSPLGDLEMDLSGDIPSHPSIHPSHPLTCRFECSKLL